MFIKCIVHYPGMAAKDVRVDVLIEVSSQDRPALASTVCSFSIRVYQHLIVNRSYPQCKLCFIISLSAFNSQYSLQPKPSA
jgi:hypothetical protein